MRITVSRTGPSLKDGFEDRMIEKLFEAEKALKEATPVDTGNARAGWTTNPEGMSIENNVEYIGVLNTGHSKQAPAGFIETALDSVFRS